MAADPVHVLWLIKGLGAGGAERLLWMFARTGNRQRFRYEVAYVVPWASVLAPAIAAEGVPVTCLGGRHQLSPGVPLRLRRLLLSGGYDVVHVHSPHVAALLRVVRLTLPRARRPVVVSTEHCTWWSYRWLTRWANALTCRLDDARIAVSTQVRTSMWRRARAGVEVVVHGVLSEELDEMDVVDRQVVRDRLGVGPGEVLVVTVGNYREQKNYAALLRTARHLLDRGLPVRFVSVGYGPLEADIRREHERLGLGAHFQLLGYRDDVTSILAASDVFALASLYEGGPIALLEAMAAGLPVVVTAVGFVPDVVEDGVQGFVVAPDRPALLTDRLAELVANRPTRDRMATAARARGRTFRVEDAVHRVERTYLRLTGTADAPVDPPATKPLDA